MKSLKILLILCTLGFTGCFKSDFKKELSESNNVENLPVKAFEYLIPLQEKFSAKVEADEELDFSKLPEPQWFDKLITMAENQFREKSINQEDFIQVLNLASYFCRFAGQEIEGETKYEPCLISALEKNSLMGSNSSAVKHFVENSPNKKFVLRLKPARVLWNMCLMVGHKLCLTNLVERFSSQSSSNVLVANNVLRSKLLLGLPTANELKGIYAKANQAYKTKGDVFLLYSLAYFYRYSGDFKSCMRFSDIYAKKVGSGEISNAGDAWKMLNHAICQRATKDYSGAQASLSKIQSALDNDAYFGKWYWQVESTLNNLALGKSTQSLQQIDSSILMNQEDALLLNGFVTAVKEKDANIMKEALFQFEKENPKQSFSYIYFNDVYTLLAATLK